MAQRKIILILSGEIGAGKSTLSSNLVEKFGFKVLKTRELIKHIAQEELKGRHQIPKNKEEEREFYQKLGRKLDIDEKGKWVLEGFRRHYGSVFQDHNLFLIDSVRIKEQINHFREAYSISVFHIHLTAPPDVLQERVMARGEYKELSKKAALEKYRAAKSDETEQQVNNLAKEADLLVDTDHCNEEDVLIKATSFFGWLAPIANALVDIVVGGQFGSEGKGQIAAHIAPEYDCLVRVGGPNAGHSVFETPNKHVFHLLPSGTWRNQNAQIVLGAGMVINVDKLLHEINFYKVQDELQRRLFIDENAIIIRQEDIDKEQKLKAGIGSTGQGVGYATANNILARLKADDSHKAKNSKQLTPYIADTLEILEQNYRQNKKILVEGTQGTGLSLQHGIYPYVTSRDTSVSGCLSEAGISPRRVRKIVMVVRRYPIRVGGSSGPFESDEIDIETVAARSGNDPKILRQKEITTTTKVERRIAEFSWKMFRRACELNSPTDICLTFADYISIHNKQARRYDQLTSETLQFIEDMERCSGVNVSLIGVGFDYRAIIDRRNWK